MRTAKGERRRIRSFLKEIEKLGVELEDLPPVSLKALGEADRFLGRYLDILARETPNVEQLEGVMEGLGGIDRVVRNAMGEILKSLGWKPERPAPGATPVSGPAAKPAGRRKKKVVEPAVPADQIRGPGSATRSRTRPKPGPGGGTIIPFPGPRSRRPRR